MSTPGAVAIYLGTWVVVLRLNFCQPPCIYGGQVQGISETACNIKVFIFISSLYHASGSYGRHLINYKQTPIDHTLDCRKIRLPLSNPSLDAPKVATCVFGRCVEDDLVAFALPFHGGEIGMAL